MNHENGAQVATRDFELSWSFWKEAEEALRDERRRLIDVLIASSGPGDEVQGEWQQSDSPSQSELRDVQCWRHEALHHRLREIDAAIERIRDASYGECTICGETIGPRRLENDPAVSLCLVCQCAIEGDSCTPTM